MPNLDAKFSKLKTNATRALDKDPVKRAFHNEDSFHIERTQEITLEQQVEQQIEVAEEIEEANELALVEGCPLPIENLVTYTKFEQQYKAQAEEKYSKEGADNLFAVYKQEFFANLPNAIKYLSPEAA